MGDNMRVLKRLLGVASACLIYGQMVLAQDVAQDANQDVALVIGDLGQVDYLQDGTPTSARDFTSPLRRAGFKVVQPRKRSSGHMRLTAQGVETTLTKGHVDRLVIIVLGPIAHTARESWVMSNGATGPTALNIGVTALPIGALSDMAIYARGPAVIMISPGRDATTLGVGLMPGMGPLRLADGVTYVTGPATQLVQVLTDGLLDSDKTFADVAHAAPANVRFQGAVSDQIGLMRK